MSIAETEQTTEPLTDREGRVWTWDPGLYSWCHDDGERTLLRGDLDVEPDPVDEIIAEGAEAECRGWFVAILARLESRALPHLGPGDRAGHAVAGRVLVAAGATASNRTHSSVALVGSSVALAGCGRARLWPAGAS